MDVCYSESNFNIDGLILHLAFTKSSFIYLFITLGDYLMFT